MLRVWIGGWRHVEHLDPTKAHTVYQVEVTTQSGRYFRVERRYSAFHSLNKECKKQGVYQRYHSQSQGGNVAEFPPKRIRNTSAKVLESRRTGLEHYIQSLARIVPTPPQLTAFLELPVSTGETESYSSQVFGFKEDPFIRGPGDSSPLSDMVTQATLLAFYGGS